MARGSVKARPLKDGTVRYRVKWEDRGPDGARRHHSATRPTKKAADALLAQKLAEVDRGDFVARSKESVGAFLDRWLVAASPGWRGATELAYRSIVRKRIAPRLGEVPLARLDAAAIQGLYAELLAAGYAAKSVQLTHTVLHGALARAVTWRLIPRNPADGALLPRRERPVPVAWTAEEATRFLAATVDDDEHALWRVTLDTGMRIGEGLALGWADVDLANGVVTVHRTLTRTRGGEWVVGDSAKTASGRRSVPIGGATVAALRRHRARQAERRLLAGGAWHDRGIVFDRGDGRPHDPTTVGSRFARAVSAAGVARLTPHGLRHTTATLLLGASVHPKIVQERLGHKSIRETMDLYSHVLPTMQGEAATAMEELLGGGARPRRGHGG